MKDNILKYVNDLKNLPSLPEISLEIMKVLQSPEASLSQAVKSVRKDPSLSMKVMKVANSARYGGTMNVTALEVAAGRLGISMIRQLALIDGVMNIFPPSRGGYETRKYWEHSMCTALVSEDVLKKISGTALPKKIECFTAAILHGIGLLILELGFPKATYKVAEISMETSEVITNVEQSILGITYPECGDLLSRYWSLPEQVSSTIRWHHNPQLCPEVNRPICEITYMSKYIATHQTLRPSVFNKTSLTYYPEIFEKYNLSIDEEEMSKLANNALENSLNII